MSRSLPRISAAGAGSVPAPAWSDPGIALPGAADGGATPESMVLGAITAAAEPCGFACRRAWREAERVDDPGRRRHLLKALRTCTDPAQDGAARTCSLLEWAGYHEGRCQFGEAAAILDRAVLESPRSTEPVLGRARVARKDGDVARARALYRRVRELARDEAVVAELAAVGEAMVADDPESALTRAIARLRRLPVAEATAVALEARADVRRRQGRVGAALRDYLGAAARFDTAMDRGRIGQVMADLLVAAGEPGAAREVLLYAVRHAHPRQRAAVASRLRVLARTMGDEIGVRRWSDAPMPELVPLGPSSRWVSGADVAGRRARHLAGWLRRLEALRRA